MYYLNLDPNFNPFNSDAENTIRFSFATKDSKTLPGGEPDFKLLDKSLKFADMSLTTLQCIITHRIKSFEDLGLLIMAVDVLKANYIDKIGLFLPYFPATKYGSRFSIRRPFHLKLYADLINKLNLSFVTTFDPHCPVTAALVDRIEVVSNFKFVRAVLKQKDLNDFNFIIPGFNQSLGLRTLGRFLSKRNFRFNTVQCERMLNEQAKCTGFKVFANDLNGKDCVIVENIFDNGFDLKEIATELKNKNAGKIHLICSHGLFQDDADTLLQYFDTITTTDSFYNGDDERINLIKLSSNIL